MKVKMILPALTEATSPFFRPIKYSLFPPLGLATLAGYLSEEDSVELVDEHVERIRLNDNPELVVIEVYITAAKRAYELADYYRQRGAYVCVGGLHVTALPEEAARHADSIFLGPGEDTWPRFLEDFRHHEAAPVYRSVERRLDTAPQVRRDLIKRSRYFVPNSLLVSRGCPHHCDFCYKDSFYAGGKSFYTQRVDKALEEIATLPGRHLFFLDDNLFADAAFARALFSGLEGMGRVWQGAATVEGVMKPGLLELAAKSGLRSLFIGFETLNELNLRSQNKNHNMHRDYAQVIERLHDNGVMVNASFVFGMDADDPDVFDRTVEWAVASSIETATFHILTPYPGTKLYERMTQQGRMLSSDWNEYDTRHCVFKPMRMTPEELETGYWRAYDQFYSWKNIVRATAGISGIKEKLRHIAYKGGWKKCEPLWAFIIHSGLLGTMRPLLETVLDGIGKDSLREEFPDMQTVDELHKKLI